MMSAATAPAKRTAENVSAVTDEGSQVQLIQMRRELDLATADGLTERGYAAMGRGPRVLLIDLAHVSFCDLCGSARWTGSHQADRAGCRYGLLAIQPQVVSLLQLTSLEKRLRVFGTASDALAQLMTVHSGCPQ
jgi:anti-sigma B factor antagonist